MVAAQKAQPVIIDLNGTNDKGESTFAGYTLQEAMKVACESYNPEAMTWLRCWYNGELTTMNSTPENF